uniref:Uncharacterized protein n=1 Tax=Kalanchoe fedtschenkoi TaxID=63787 RepID=A0A7N0UZY5_KALFE
MYTPLGVTCFPLCWISPVNKCNACSSFKSQQAGGLAITGNSNQKFVIRLKMTRYMVRTKWSKRVKWYVTRQTCTPSC